MIRRREFITLLGGAAAWPLAARAEQRDRVRRIGVLLPGVENAPPVKARLSAFIQALAALGWTDGRNVRMDLRSGRNDINRIRALAQELVGLQPDIIFTNAAPGRSPPAGDADDPDHLCERGRSRRQRHRRGAQSPGW
jgi:putative ABC transport system substrate-binding protein